MTDIYNQHDKAFTNVGAYVICKNNERVATIAFKFPKDGAGRLWVYVHFIGVPMVRAYAGGYGYDKASACVESAAGLIVQEKPDQSMEGKQWYEMHRIAQAEQVAAFKAALKDIGGKDWHDALRDAGYTVLAAL